MVSFISLVFLLISCNLKSCFAPSGYNKCRCLNEVLTICWFILSGLQYVFGQGDGGEEAGKGMCSMAEPSVVEESGEEKLEDSKH